MPALGPILVSPDTHEHLKAELTPDLTYAERSVLHELVGYRKRQRALRAPRFSAESWATAFR